MPSRDFNGPRLGAVTLAIAGLAVATAELAIAHPDVSPYWSLTRAFAWSATADLHFLATARSCRDGRSGARHGRSAVSAWYVVGLVAAFALPTLVAIFRAAWTGRPGPMELSRWAR